MKFYLAFLIALASVIAPNAMAQTVSGGVVNGTYAPGFFTQSNFVKNPSAFKNLAGITASGGTLTRLTSGGIEGGYGISWTPSAAGQTLDFALNTFDGGIPGQNCEARLSYKGAGSSNVNLRMRQNAADIGSIVPLVDTTTIIPASPNVGVKMTPVPFACGDGSATTVIRLTSLASGSAIVLGKVYAGLHQTSMLPLNNLADLTNLSTARTNLGLGTFATVTPTGTAATNTFLNGSGAYAQALIPSNNLSDLASAPTARTNLGLGTIATLSPTGTANSTTFLSGAGTWLPQTGAVWGNITGTLSNQTDLVNQLGLNLKIASNLSDLANAATARTNLGLGTLSTVTPTGTAATNTFLNGSGAYAQALIPANNLSDVASTTTARTNLGLGTLATVTPTGTANSSTFLSGAGTYVPIAKSNLNINYIGDTDGSNGTVGAWTAYANTASAIPVNGTGGSPTVTVTNGTTAPLLYGSNYYLFTHPASNTQGQGLSIPFTIDAGAQAKPLQISIPYSVASGTYSGGTPTTDSDIEAYIYDVTNAQVIQPTAFKFDCAVVNTNCQVFANFQSASNSTSYRLLLHNATTTTSAFTLKFQAGVSPNIKSFGVPASDLVSAGVNVITASTNPSKGTIANDVVRLGRIGDHARIKGEYRQTAAGSTSGTGDYLVTLPNNLSFDANKISFYTGDLNAGGVSTALSQVSLGSATFSNNSNPGQGWVIPYDATHFRIFLWYTSNSNAATNTGFFGTLFGLSSANLAFSYDFEAAIQGWGSNIQLQDQSGDNRVIAARANRVAAQTIPATTNTKIALDTVDTDKTGTFSVSQGRFNILTPGSYRISGQVSYAPTTAGTYTTSIFKNGAAVSYTDGYGTVQVSPNATTVVDCVAGDYIELYAFASASAPIVTGSVRTFMNIERVGGNTQTAIGESVSATYGLTTAQSVAANSVIKYDTKVKDTHSAYSVSTGLFTAPVSGTYKVGGAFYNNNATSNLFVKVNGVAVGYVVTSFSQNIYNGTLSVPVLAGQTIGVYADTAANFTQPGAGGFVNQVTFEKTGN